MCCSHLSLYGVDTLNARYLIHYYMLFNSNHETIFFLISLDTQNTSHATAASRPPPCSPPNTISPQRKQPERRSFRNASWLSHTNLSDGDFYGIFSHRTIAMASPEPSEKGRRAKKRELWVLFSAPCVNGRKVIFMRFNHFLFILVYIASPTTLLGENVLPLVLFAGAALDEGGLCGLPIVIFRDFFSGKVRKRCMIVSENPPPHVPNLVSSCVQLNYYFALFPTTDIYRND